MGRHLGIWAVYCGEGLRRHWMARLRPFLNSMPAMAPTMSESECLVWCLFPSVIFLMLT